MVEKYKRAKPERVMRVKTKSVVIRAIPVSEKKKEQRISKPDFFPAICDFPGMTGHLFSF
jgi:hypothetical protein